MTETDLVDVYTIMAALEGSAARNVTRLNPSARAQLVRALKETNAGFVAAAKRRNRNFDEMFELHNAFHAELMDVTASPRLRILIDRVRPQVHRYEYVYAAMVGPDYKDTFREHAAIIRAVRIGTASAAETAVKANWIKSAERLRESFAAMGPRGVW
ncbi:MAG: GntR family transcriptional regulator [Gemmatimonadaceae bacterium]|nr:GntR family transcriptional regulator [Gemmatimonadaceae bacterium]